jgi:hypothetical protein
MSVDFEYSNLSIDLRILRWSNTHLILAQYLLAMSCLLAKVERDFSSRSTALIAEVNWSSILFEVVLDVGTDELPHSS